MLYRKKRRLTVSANYTIFIIIHNYFTIIITVAIRSERILSIIINYAR